MGPLEEGYELEQKWFTVCRESHDLWCLCGDFRQHFLPGCGVVTEATTKEDTGEGDGIDDVMVAFDLGDPTGDAEDGTEDAG